MHCIVFPLSPETFCCCHCFTLWSWPWPWILRHTQARAEMQSLHLVLGSPCDLLPAGCAWNTSLRRCSGGIDMRCTNHINWLLSMQRSSSSTPSPSPITASHPITNGDLRHTQTHARHLYLWSCFFQSWPTLHDPRWESQHRVTVDQDLCLLAELSFCHIMW